MNILEVNKEIDNLILIKSIINEKINEIENLQNRYEIKSKVYENNFLELYNTLNKDLKELNVK